MSSNSKFVVYIDQEKINPQLAKDTVIKYDPLRRSDPNRGFYLDEQEELHIADSDVMEMHKLCINKYPVPGAIRLIRLPDESGTPIHQFAENGFRLYNLPEISPDKIIGLLGPNGVGKSVSMDIISGRLRPNLAQSDASIRAVLEQFRGTVLHQHLLQVFDQELSVSYKIQRVEQLQQQDIVVKKFLSDVPEELISALGILHVMSRRTGVLSGGELQRVLLARHIAADAQLYVFDEPSTYLDVKQRLNTAKLIAGIQSGSVFVIDHDLTILDMCSDQIHVYYGDPSAFGYVSDSLSVREGINQYITGYLRSHNIAFRKKPLEFSQETQQETGSATTLLEYSALSKNLETFNMEVSSGQIRRKEVVAVFGENALGKTVFAKLLAGVLTADSGNVDSKTIAYKPQHIKASSVRVEDFIDAHIDMTDVFFKKLIRQAFGLDMVYDQTLESLSGGQLQKLAITYCLSQDAQLYVLDEPSAYLDVEARLRLSSLLKEFVAKKDTSILLIDHDLLLLANIAQRGIVFSGTPGIQGTASQPMHIRDALNVFLSSIDVTFRVDRQTSRLRANKPGSQKDIAQKTTGMYVERA